MDDTQNQNPTPTTPAPADPTTIQTPQDQPVTPPAAPEENKTEDTTNPNPTV